MSLIQTPILLLNGGTATTSYRYHDHVKARLMNLVIMIGRRLHRCPYCNKAFPSSARSLQKHMWIHEGLKPFQCEVCTYACRSQSNLSAHMLRHSSEKPFLCTKCGKPYKSRTALRWHVRSHKPGHAFACTK